MIIVQFLYSLALISSCADQRLVISEKELLSSRFNFFVFTKDFTKQLVLVVKSIFKFSGSQRKTLGGCVITYIRVRVGDVSQNFAHEAKAGEVVCLVLGLLILL
jgi:hypothetical protein